MRLPRTQLLAVAAVLVVSTACAGSSPPPAARATASPTPSPTLSASPSPTATSSPTVVSDCTPSVPDPNRPVLTLDLDVQGRHVSGREQLRFTPDLAVTELVLRLWAAAPRLRRSGGSTTLRTVRVDGEVRPYTRPTPTLVRIPWQGASGTTLTIDLDFDVTLPVGADDRLGSRGSTSWLGSGFPLLAWERGRGWATEPATSAFAEASTSEEMDLARLTVRHAPGLSVIATGDVVAEDAGRTVTRASAVRDVAVAVGDFRMVTLPGKVPVVVGVDPSVPDDARTVAKELARALKVHTERFGAYPYGRLVAAVVPDVRGGIEYPGAMFLGKGQAADATASHEVAHEWFYGLVGNNQGRDPWLDEAFATYAEALDRNSAASYRRVVIPADGRNKVGQPMTYWEGRPSYFRSVYLQGAVALLDARRTQSKAFDAQLRCYVAMNAHRIVRPEDVARDLPLAGAALRRVGALVKR